ncbi:hypothetical protein JCM3765_003419 [Sporobolomyces pararoseus]
MSSLFFLPNGYSPSTSNNSSIEDFAHLSELKGSTGGMNLGSFPRVESISASHQQQIAIAPSTIYSTQLEGFVSEGAKRGLLNGNEVELGNISQRNFSEEIDTISSNSPTISFSSSSLCAFSPSTRNTRSGRRFSTTSTTSNTSSSTTTTIPSRSHERRRPRTKSLSSSPSTSTSPGISIPTTKTKRNSIITKQETVVRHQARDPKTGAFISTTNRKRTSSKPPPPPSSSSKRRRSSSTTSTKENELFVPFVIPYVELGSGGGGNEKRRKRTREEAQHLEDEEWEKWNKMIGLNSLRDYEMVEEMGGRGALRKWGWWKGGEEEKKENYDEGGGTRGREPEKFAVDERESGAERVVGADEGENQVVVVLSKLSDPDPQRQQSSNLSSPILSNPSSISTGDTSNLTQETEIIDSPVTPNLPAKNENNVRKRNRITRLSPVTLGSRSSTRLALKQSIILEEQEEGKKEEDAGDRIEGEILTPDGKQEQKSVLAEGASPTAVVAGNDIKALNTQDVEQVGMRRINGRGRVSDPFSFNGPGDRTADEQDVLEALLSLGGFVNREQEPASKKVESKEEAGERLMETL